MAFSSSLTNTFFLLTILVVLLPVETYAFGAGDIPDFAYLNDKAFRHGDIENILETLAKTSGAAIGGSGLLGFASSIIKQASGGSKFSKSDVKKVYFGNWLRDYSQAMDIAGLSKLSADTLVLIVSVLGFMTFGFASDEFQVTPERLGVYLPVEHIDNPKGYAEKEGDARTFHPKLRPPVSPRELEIDSRTGMKKYIATENQGWDTSTAFIRRTLRACIQHGRQARGQEGPALWEAYRLLGTGLHTMEDLLAHSNWCELALRKMGHEEVFCHVGDNVTVNTPNGRAPPLITGTFGSADFMHSLLGEAGDKLSQASVTDLSAKMDSSTQGNGPDLSVLKTILGKLGGGDDKMNQAEEMEQQAKAYNFNPDDIAPPEVQEQLLGLLKWHDEILKSVIEKIEMVPGLSNLLDEFSNALNAYIYTILAPYLGPILTQATGVLNEGSKAVIDSDDQYEVFNNPDASDPSHSLLSKDHFGLILNEPAGKIAQIVDIHSVNLIVEAWSNDSDPDQVITQILEAFHHPYYATGRSDIQNQMLDHMESWIGGLGSEAADIIESLTKESVRDHKNKRHGLDDTEEAGYGGCGHGYTPSRTSGNNASSGGYQSSGQTGYGQESTTDYDAQPQSNTYGGYGGARTSGGYGYGSQRDDDDSGRGRYESSTDDTPSYGGREESSYGRQQEPTYGGRQEPSYGGRQESSYGGHEEPSYGGRQEPSYGGRQEPSYDSQPEGRQEHHRRRDDDDDNRNSARTYESQPQRDYAAQSGGYAPSYGQPEQPNYGGNEYSRAENNDDDDGRHKRHGHRHHDSDEDKPRRQQQEYEQPSYSQPEERETSYGQQEYGQQSSRRQQGYGEEEYGQRGYAQPEESYGQSETYGQQPSGYAPTYGGRDDTFGAENLNIGGDDEDNEGGERRHHGRHDYGGEY